MSSSFPLFSVFGIEIEYMIVDVATLKVRPDAPFLLTDDQGNVWSDRETQPIATSNELVMHLIECKTFHPEKNFLQVAQDFALHVRHLNRELKEIGAVLMPGAMHPWMNPVKESRLWKYEYQEIYEKYHELFDCYRHGWANVQSMHLNLPFSGDEEFSRLHRAVRFLLPMMPALSASSPIIEGKPTGKMATRLEYYRHHADRVPSLVGDLIPERISTEEEYRKTILEPIYIAMKAMDPEQIMGHEWMNARGAIARFDRNAIEVRVLDSQECPAADIAIAEILFSTLRMLVDEKFISATLQDSPEQASLSTLFDAVAKSAEQAEVADLTYLACFGRSQPCSAQTLWQLLLAEVENYYPLTDQAKAFLSVWNQKGSLGRRIMDRLATDSLETIYRELVQCLEKNQLFPLGK